MIAAIKKNYIICRDSRSAGAWVVLFAFSFCKVSYLWIRHVISGLGFKIRNSLMSVSHTSLERCTWHCCLKWLLLDAIWQDLFWLLFHRFWFSGETSVYLWFSQELHSKCSEQKEEEDERWWRWLSWAWHRCSGGLWAAFPVLSTLRFHLDVLMYQKNIYILNCKAIKAAVELLSLSRKSFF